MRAGWKGTLKAKVTVARALLLLPRSRKLTGTCKSSIWVLLGSMAVSASVEKKVYLLPANPDPPAPPIPSRLRPFEVVTSPNMSCFESGGEDGDDESAADGANARIANRLLSA